MEKDDDDDVKMEEEEKTVSEEMAAATVTKLSVQKSIADHFKHGGILQFNSQLDLQIAKNAQNLKNQKQVEKVEIEVPDEV